MKKLPVISLMTMLCFSLYGQELPNVPSKETLFKENNLAQLYNGHLKLEEEKPQTVLHAKNSIYLELGGNGGLYSVNYERNFLKSINCRIGFSSYWTSWGFSSGTIRYKTLPITITWLSGKKANHIELGGGVLFKNEHKELNALEYFNKFIDITAFLGYRYQPQTKGILIRIGLTPFFPTYENYNPMLSGGASIGYHF